MEEAGAPLPQTDVQMTEVGTVPMETVPMADAGPAVKDSPAVDPQLNALSYHAGFELCCFCLSTLMCWTSGSLS